MFKCYFLFYCNKMNILRSKYAKILRYKKVKIFTNILYKSLYLTIQKFYGFYIRLTRNKNNPMVFCVGFSKTGTSSLDKALSILGYRNVHWLHAGIKPKKGWIQYIKNTPFDAFSDSPMFHSDLFKKIDKAFPGSKFILTVRNPDSLVKSWKYYFSISPWSIDNEEDKKTIIDMYNDHKKNVIEYFKDRPDDLLILDILEGDGWDKLCKFLDKTIPKIPFPRKRISKYKSKN